MSKSVHISTATTFCLVSQSGFRPGYSCSTALLNITDDILRANDQDKVTALIVLDYSNVSDTINHKLLLAILHQIGFHSTAKRMIECYLENRKQCVVLNNNKFNFLVVTCGVLQGSTYSWPVTRVNLHLKTLRCLEVL